LLKHKTFLFQIIILQVLILFMGITSCKSTPLAVEVDPLDILDSESAFYIAIPSNVDPDLIPRIIQNNVNGISEANARLLAGKINKVYCGLNHTKNKTSIQASFDAAIPQKYVSKVLNKNNGFSKRLFTAQKSANEYTVYANKNLELTFPSAKVLALGRDIDNVLQSYDNIFTSAEPDYSYLQYSNLNPQLYEFLHEAQDEIRFFANKPQSFLTILTGANLNLKLSSVKGTFVSDPKVENQYLVDLTFNFQNEKFLKAGRTLLSLAFGLTDSQTYTDNNNVLIIKGIKINKDSLYRLIKI